MSRHGALSLLAAALAAVLLTPAFAGPEKGTPRVKNTKRSIEALAMDGSIVAYDLAGEANQCNQIYSWNLSTNGGKVLSGPATCNVPETSTGLGVAEIGITANRVAWVVNEGGNTESSDYLYTSALSKPRERALGSATRSGDVDSGELTGGWIGGLAGDRDLLVVSSWKTSRGAITSGALQTIGPTGRKTIATGRGAVVSVSVSGGRIAVLRGNGTVAVYSRTGALLRTINAAAREAALDGKFLAVLNPRGLTVYDASSGARLHSWAKGKNAERLDADSGIAVFTPRCEFVDQCPGRVYATRMTLGKTVQLGAPGVELVGLQIESSGVAYAYKGRRNTIVVRSRGQVEAALT